MLHHRRNMKRYKHFMQSDKQQPIDCGFCDVNQMAEIIEENATMRILKNRVPYDVFETLVVEDHLLIIPKAHKCDFGEFDEQENLDYMAFVASYQDKNYNIYVRAPRSSTRSIKHIHSHLLLMPGRKLKSLLYLDKPYLVLHERRFSQLADKIKKR